MQHSRQLSLHLKEEPQMPNTKPTGEQLADQIRHHDYDPDFMVGFLVGFVGHIVDKRTVKPAHKAARDVLESLADFDAFVADVPSAKRRQS